MPTNTNEADFRLHKIESAATLRVVLEAIQNFLNSYQKGFGPDMTKCEDIIKVRHDIAAQLELLDATKDEPLIIPEVTYTSINDQDARVDPEKYRVARALKELIGSDSDTEVYRSYAFEVLPDLHLTLLQIATICNDLIIIEKALRLGADISIKYPAQLCEATIRHMFYYHGITKSSLLRPHMLRSSDLQQPDRFGRKEADYWQLD